MYREHREEIAGTLQQLRAPGTLVADRLKWMHALDLGEDILRLFPEEPSAIDAARLPDYVNATYDVMLAMIDLKKHALDLPKVPRRSRPAPDAR